jgi:hypothetical protein
MRYARGRPNYELGFAESTDGMQWRRSWENVERDDPVIFNHSEYRYMLYNSNGYGRTGFGITLFVH